MKNNTPEYRFKQCKKTHPKGYLFNKTNFNLGHRGINVFECKTHGTFEKTLRDFLRTKIPCNECWELSKIKKRKEGLKKNFDYSKTNFNISEQALNKFICKEHGLVEVSLCDHKRYKSGGCAKCYFIILNMNLRMDLKEFIELAKIKHKKSNYDYSGVHQFYNQHEPVTIICKKKGHGEFSKSPANHLHKTKPQGCPECSSDNTKKLLSMTKAYFLEKAKMIHGNSYKYINLDFKNTKDRIQIQCKKCSANFNQVISYHLAGHGCKKCGSERTKNANKTLTNKIIVKKCIEVWGDQYDYSKVNYQNNNEHIEVICKTHGSFHTNYHNHVGLKRGCKKCGFTRRQKQNDWLDYMKIPDTEQTREVAIRLYDGSLIYADGYDPKKKIVYEFNGDYFHGNLNVFAKDQINAFTHRSMQEENKRTQAKAKKILKSGFKLISIWEADWDKFKKKLD